MEWTGERVVAYSIVLFVLVLVPGALLGLEYHYSVGVAYAAGGFLLLGIAESLERIQLRLFSGEEQQK